MLVKGLCVDTIEMTGWGLIYQCLPRWKGLIKIVIYRYKYSDIRQSLAVKYHVLAKRCVIKENYPNRGSSLIHLDSVDRIAQ